MEYKIKPWAHQLEAIKKAQTLNNFALFFEAGTGKTGTVINMLRDKFASLGQRLLPTLILAPPITLPNWKREWMMHSDLKDEDIVILAGSGKQRLATLNAIKTMPKIIITNYEALLMKELFSALYDYAPRCAVFDESHRLKDSKSKRSMAAARLADTAVYRYILTGSPVLNNLMDLFWQFRILDGGAALGKNFFIFRNTYFYNKNSGAPSHVTWPDWRTQKGAEEIIRSKIDSISMHVEKSKCLDLPPFVKKKIYVEMGDDQKKAYDSMLNDFIAFVNDQACVAELAITKALRLQQIVSGFLRVSSEGDPSDISFKKNPRIDALSDLLEELTPKHKVIVWCVFKENYKQVRELCEKLKIKYVEVHGEISPGGKNESVDSFNNNPDVRVLLGHPGSGGIGINLVSASYSIFYSRNFSLENDIQAEARNFRGGSEIHEKVTRIDLVTTGTIDEKVLVALENKTAIGEKILRGFAEDLRHGRK